MDKVGGNANFLPDHMRSFSTMLALRYLNPKRAYVSWITVISLLGVALGVAVLIITLGVMNGFEDLVKKQILGFSPHVKVRRIAPWSIDEQGNSLASEQWGELQKRLEQDPEVLSAYAIVVDYVLLDAAGLVQPVSMWGIDTQNTSEVESLNQLLIEGDADMGLGDVVVISAVVQEQFGLGLGDTLQVVSNRNLKGFQQIRERHELGRATERFSESFSEVHRMLDELWLQQDGRERMEFSALSQWRELLELVIRENIRLGEREQIEDILHLTRSGEYDDIYNYYPLGRKEEISAALGRLAEVDLATLDEAEQTEIEEVILPRDLQIVGIYQTAKQYAAGPELFVPLPVGQELKDIDQGIDGLGLKLRDPDLAESVSDRLMGGVVDYGWEPKTWMQAHAQQFSLIHMQKFMMIIVLSAIVLVAAFCIMAVMFTVTVQKKREIGVMKALGASSAQVIGVFASQGVIVGIGGGILGLIAGMVVLKNLERIQKLLEGVGVNPFPKSFYAFDYLPHKIIWSEVVTIMVGSFLLCVLAAFFPAWLASRRDAARSLRNL